MPAIDFPTSPYTGQNYVFDGKTWVYNGYAWVITNSASGPQIYTPFIPAPQPFAVIKRYRNVMHNHGQALPVSDELTPSWSDQLLRLRYQAYDTTFLNYNPKYFLFIYKPRERTRTVAPVNMRLKNTYVHPTNCYRDGGGFIRGNPTYQNFSSSVPNLGAGFNPLFSAFSTEWSVAPKTGEATILDGFDPLRFYALNAQSWQAGYEFFPMAISDYNKVSVTTCKNKKRWPAALSAQKPRVTLHVKFAIVIQNPYNTNNFIVGPYSEPITITPVAGYFNDGSETLQKYYYAWNVKII